MDMSPIPENREASLPHETFERRGGRSIMVAIDHHADSRRAFSWALTHLVRMADTVHLIYVLPILLMEISKELIQQLFGKLPRDLFAHVRQYRSFLLYNADHTSKRIGSCISVGQRESDEESALTQGTEVLMDKLAREAYEVAMVKTEPLILEGDAGKVICSEVARLQPAALVMGCRGRGMVKSVLWGSVSEYCMRHSTCAVIIVPHKEEREEALDAEKHRTSSIH